MEIRRLWHTVRNFNAFYICHGGTMIQMLLNLSLREEVSPPICSYRLPHPQASQAQPKLQKSHSKTPKPHSAEPSGNLLLDEYHPYRFGQSQIPSRVFRSSFWMSYGPLEVARKLSRNVYHPIKTDFIHVSHCRRRGVTIAQQRIIHM